MGCDIHAYVEQRMADGAWAFAGWRGSDDAAPFEEPRDYNLFAFLAGVRNYIGIPPIAQPRGFPSDASGTVLEACEMWGVDGHTHSWVAVDELLIDYEARFELWDEFTREPTGETGTLREHLAQEYFEDLARLEQLNAVRPTRVVFWFDN